MRNVSDKSCRKNQNILCSVTSSIRSATAVTVSQSRSESGKFSVTDPAYYRLFEARTAAIKKKRKGRTCPRVRRDSSVGIATCYELDVPGIEYRWGREFSHPSRPVTMPTQPYIQLVPGLFPRGKAD
jgi:hypothetical protein